MMWSLLINIHIWIYDGNDAPVSADYNWIQSHDVDANMTSAPDGGNVFFTQIGSMYDAKSSANVVDADASISYFNGVL